MVGVNVKFKGKNEKKEAAAPVVQTKIEYVTDNSEIDRLNGEINKLRADNERLKNQQPVNTKTVITDEKVVTYPYFVNFEINKTDIANRERVNLSTIAQMIKQNPGKKYNVMGYADKATGTADRNAWLAENRAKNVYDLLIKEYGVPASSLVLDSKGGVENLYFNDPQMSRSVIISEVK
jgi:outer membrane protein OmpA-like peptidoglycan-associated protein